MTAANPRSATLNIESKRKFSNKVPPGLHYLPSLDPKSDEFVELFRSFLSSEEERASILGLPVEDAKLFVEIIDSAFRAARLEIVLHRIAFSILRRLCGRVGHIPSSYLLSDEFDLSGLPRASGGFSDVRVRALKGKDVAVRTLRVSELEDKARIRKRFCKEVALWKNLSHPNVLNLIGVPDTLEGGRFSVVSEWMVNGNIIEYVRNNADNHLKLLADAVEGLKYLHNANIVHGDLKGPNILIKNTNPVTACLADFGFMTIVFEPSLEMESSKQCELGGGTTPFMAPELLVPSKFGLAKCAPSKEADVYAMGMAIYQVLTGVSPFGKLSGPEVVLKVLTERRPSKPANVLELGLSDNVWRLLGDCWQTERTRRPSVMDVLDRVKVAALACGTLSSIGGMPQEYEDPQSIFNKFDQLFLEMTDGEEIGPYLMDRHPPSQRSTSTDVSALSDSLFSQLSEAESSITEPDQTNTGALQWGSGSKCVSTDSLPHILFNPAPDPTLPTRAAIHNRVGAVPGLDR